MSRLSVAYIVKNEIENLPESIRMTRDLVDEIVVVDTGSKDGTWEWIKSRKDIISKQIKWKDDYAEARNVSLSLCTKPWILVIDADEWIDKQYFEFIRAAIEVNFNYYGYYMTIHNFITSPFWDPHPQIMYGKAVRLFRNRNSIRYDGCVHNQLTGIDEILKNTLDVAVYHFQYRERFNYKEKAKRNLALLEKREIKTGRNFNTCVWHGDIYKRLWLWFQEDENLETAVDWFKMALTYPPDTPGKVMIINKVIKQCEVILNGKHENNKVQEKLKPAMASGN